MTTFAHVPNVPGPVKEVFVGDKLFDMHKDFAATWFKAPDGIDQHWNFDGKKFTQPKDNSAEIAWRNLQRAAHAAMHKSDAVALRCFKRGIEFPAEWQKYDAALQEIIDAKEIDSLRSLPEPPKDPTLGG